MDFATVLKAEIARLARKELRAETKALKKAVAGHRSEIAALKRRAQDLEKQLRQRDRLRQADGRGAGAEPAEGTVRFSAKGLTALRRRLELSAEDLGLLLGVSGQSVYNWESGQVRPRASVLPRIAALRALGKREAAARLDALRGAQS